MNASEIRPEATPGPRPLDPRMSCLGVISRLALVAAALLVLLVIALQIGAAWKEKQVDRSWGLTREPLSRLFGLFARRDANSSATKLVELAAAVGVDLSEGKAERARPGKSKPGSDEAIRDSSQEYLKRQLERANDAIDPLPEPVASYLESRKQALLAVCEHLRGEDVPRWRQSGGDFDADVPNLRGILRLERLLVTAALESQRRGDAQGASDLLEASWKLNVSVTERAELVSQLSAISGGNLIVGAVRKVGAPSRLWRDRFGRFPSRESFLYVLETEAARATHYGKRGAPAEGSPSESRLLRPLWTPYMRLSMAGYAENMRQVVEDLKTENLCRYDPARAKVIWNRPFPGWNRLGKLVWPKDFDGFPWRLFYHLLQRELTLAVLEANEAAASSGGPPASTETESTVCPHERWSTEISPGGSVTVSFSRGVPLWPKLAGVILPLEFSSSPGTRARASSEPRSLP